MARRLCPAAKNGIFVTCAQAAVAHIVLDGIVIQEVVVIVCPYEEGKEKCNAKG